MCVSEPLSMRGLCRLFCQTLYYYESFVSSFTCALLALYLSSRWLCASEPLPLRRLNRPATELQQSLCSQRCLCRLLCQTLSCYVLREPSCNRAATELQQSLVLKAPRSMSACGDICGLDRRSVTRKKISLMFSL